MSEILSKIIWTFKELGKCDQFSKGKKIHRCQSQDDTDVRIITRKLENTIKTMFYEIKVNTFEVMQDRRS